MSTPEPAAAEVAHVASNSSSSSPHPAASDANDDDETVGSHGDTTTATVASVPPVPADTAVRYYDADFTWVPAGLLRRSVVACYPVGKKVVNTMEWIGGKVVHICGLDQSRFQYAVDEYYRQQRKKQAEETRERELFLDRVRQNATLDDDLAVPYAPPLMVDYDRLHSDERAAVPSGHGGGGASAAAARGGDTATVISHGREI